MESKTAKKDDDFDYPMRSIFNSILDPLNLAKISQSERSNVLETHDSKLPEEVRVLQRTFENILRKECPLCGPILTELLESA